MDTRKNHHFFVTLKSEAGAHVTFWIDAPSKTHAVARAMRINGEPASLHDIQPAPDATHAPSETVH